MKISLLSILLFSLFSGPTRASELQAKLKGLALPGQSVAEKFVSVQTRFIPLAKRHKITLLGGTNFTGADYINSWAMGGTYQYYLSDRWSLALCGLLYQNFLNSSGKILKDRHALIPDFDYPKAQGDLSGRYNLFYGKLRLGEKKVLYFDQYWSLGGGIIMTARGDRPLGILEGGVDLWLGQKWALGLKARNHFYEEDNLLGRRLNHDLIVGTSLGILL